MKIVIDNREPEELYNYVKNLVDIKNITLEKACLDLGDIIIYKNNTEYPDIIIERKSINDLIASLKDGRYNEQSFRLDKYPIHNHNIFYIIERSIERISNLITKQTIYSTLFTLNHFKGFSVLNSQNLKQTGELIFRFSDKLLRENKRKSYYGENINEPKEQNIKIDNEIQIASLNNTYSSVIKATKKSNITQDNILEIMLMQIPSVSANVAQIISNKFKNMKNLINNLEKNKNCLNDLSINDKRKISKTTINNIISYILNEKFEIEVSV